MSDAEPSLSKKQLDNLVKSDANESSESSSSSSEDEKKIKVEAGGKGVKQEKKEDMAKLFSNPFAILSNTAEIL
jgi:hypothetical protein